MCNKGEVFKSLTMLSSGRDNNSKFTRIRKAMYYRGAAAAIIVYDITRPNTFNTLKNWVDELRSKGPKDIAIAIAGNKADLENQREVDKNMAMTYADEICALYLETSAKDDVNVHDVFVSLSKFPLKQFICLL